MSHWQRNRVRVPSAVALNLSANVLASNIECLGWLLSAWETGHLPDGTLCKRDASLITREGLSMVLWNRLDLARQCFETALPQLLEDLSPNGPAETADMFIPAEAPREAMAGSMSAISQRITFGWSPLLKSNWWTCVALCRWFLEGAHDSASLTNAANEQHRHHEDPRYTPYAGRVLEMDGACSVFAAAGRYDLIVRYYARSTQCKPSRMPGRVRTPRAMAWMLAARAEGRVTDRDVERAWEVFLNAGMPIMENGGQMERLTMWLKMRYWDVEDRKPDPYQTLLRLYDFFPGVARPALH